MASTPRWSESELQNLRTLLLSRQLRHSDVEHFPGRSMYGLKRKAQQLRAAMGIARPSRGRPLWDWEPVEGIPPKTQGYWATNAVNGSALLHKRTVEMALRNGITLPGKSRDETMAIAVRLGIVTRAQVWKVAA